MAEGKRDEPKGFAGLESLVSDVDKIKPLPPAEPIRESKPDLPAPAPIEDSARKAPAVNTEPKKTTQGKYLLFGWGVVGLVVIILAMTSRNSKPEQVITTWVTSPTIIPAPTYPPPPPGFKLEVPSEDRSPGDDPQKLDKSLRERGKELFTDTGTNLAVAKPNEHESIPPKSSSLLLDQAQIRYCLSQKIRLSAWETRVNGKSESSVDAFNDAVKDYNERCSSFRYHRWTMESARAQVEANRYNLQLQGVDLSLPAEHGRPAARVENVLKPTAPETSKRVERGNSDKPEIGVTAPPPAMNDTPKPSTSATHAQKVAITPVVEKRKIIVDGLEYVLIPAGTFEMGCVPVDRECYNDEYPRHRVSISKMFWLGMTEVTVVAYRHFAQVTGREMPPAPSFFQGDDHPVVNVSWDDAVAYCTWVGGRLPSEAEWEYAARGGKDGLKYPWGNTLSHENANYSGIEWRDRWANTSPVGSFEPNGFGLFDMAGNAWECCQDFYGERYYEYSTVADPTGPASGTHRVARGGSWSSLLVLLHSSYRGRDDPSKRFHVFGFRCARDVQP